MDLSPRYQSAFEYAFRQHDGHYRKGTDIPYLAHLITVSSLVMEHGGSEDEAIAGLLHDVVEDTSSSIGDVRERFGAEVAHTVAGCSEDKEDAHGNERSWSVRKNAYIARLGSPDTSRSILIVSNADKLHNMRAIVSDYQSLGDKLWERFNPEAGPEGTLWYYRNLADIYLSHPNGTPTLARELDAAVDQLSCLLA